jgi:hypothetical protein
MPLEVPGLAVVLRLGEDSGVEPETRDALSGDVHIAYQASRESGGYLRLTTERRIPGAGGNPGCRARRGHMAWPICQELTRTSDISTSGQTTCRVHLPLVEKTAHETRPTGRLTLPAKQPVGGRSIAI